MAELNHDAYGEKERKNRPAERGVSLRKRLESCPVVLMLGKGKDSTSSPGQETRDSAGRLAPNYSPDLPGIQRHPRLRPAIGLVLPTCLPTIQESQTSQATRTASPVVSRMIGEDGPLPPPHPAREAKSPVSPVG